MAGLLDAPEVLGEAARGGTGDEDQLGAVQPQHTRPFGKVAVVANVHADLDAQGALEDRITEVAGAEVVFLPEAGQVGDVGLAVLA
jgi:hypothetical protein